MYSRIELFPGMYTYNGYSAVGEYEEIFDSESLPKVFSIEADQSAVTFWSGAFPDDGSWVQRVDFSSHAPTAMSQVGCDVPREVFEVYDGLSGDTTITQDTIQGDVLFLGTSGVTGTTKYEYLFQQEP